MPLFEYKCRECDTSFEKLTSTSQRDEASCTECGSEQTERQISSFAASTSAGGSNYSMPSIPSRGFS